MQTEKTDYGGRQRRQTVEADRGDRWKQAEDADCGGRQRRQTLESDRGDRLWRRRTTKRQIEETDN
jgi:hypothetical protein